MRGDENKTYSNLSSCMSQASVERLLLCKNSFTLGKKSVNLMPLVLKGIFEIIQYFRSLNIRYTKYMENVKRHFRSTDCNPTLPKALCKSRLCQRKRISLY